MHHAVEVVAGGVCLAYAAGSEVEEVVAVACDVGVQLCNTLVRPVATDGVQHMAQNVALVDRAVDIGDDDGDVVAPVPQRGMARRAIDGETHRIRARTQVHGLQLFGRQTQRLGVILVRILPH